MINIILVLFIILLLLSGCATTTFIKPGVTQAEFNKDTLYCNQYAAQASMANALQDSIISKEYEKILAKNECMTLLGYSKIRQGN